MNPDCKVRGWAEEAEDEPAGFFHAKEVAGMGPDTTVEELAGGEFVGLESGDAQDCVPTALELESVDHGLGLELAVEFGEVCRDTGADLGLEAVALGEPDGQGELDGSVHGEPCVGEDFEAGEGFRGLRAGGENPGGFHLWEGADFAGAADDENGDAEVAGGKAGGVFGGGAAESVVQEDFIHNEGEIVAAAECGEGEGFDVGGEVAGGVVGMDEDDGAGARGDGPGEAVEVELPAVVVDEGRRG